MIGEIIDSKYRVERQLGAGGMGNVYLATHLGTTRLVAVKVIAPRWAREPQFLARFQREAQACGRLRHPNIVNVTDFGIAKHGTSDVPYLVMEYLDGHTLAEFQKTNPKIPLTLVADILDQTALALEEAHKIGIVHRDLKPENIWLEPNGRGGYTIKVLDFGVAKLNAPGGWAAPGITSGTASRNPTFAAGPTSPSRQTIYADDMETVAEAPAPATYATTRAEDLDTVALVATPGSGSALLDSGAGAQTIPGSLLGTPAYMSPEQAFGREIDFRSDIYSLAVVVYALVCGQLPFTGKPSELFEFHESGTPPAPREIAKIPDDVSDTVLAGLARRPEDRPASAIEFARRFHNSVDAEFFSLRRSKAFALQHLAAFAVVMTPAYALVLSISAIAVSFSKKGQSVAGGLAGGLLIAAFLIFADNLIRAAAAIMAVEEQIALRRFLGIRVLWKLLKKLPVLAKTQLQAAITIGPGWVIGDCLWATICIVEGLSGGAAIARSRQLMTGLHSVGRALAIRHYALALLTIGQALQSAGAVFQAATEAGNKNIQITAVWFPWFAALAAAPLFLYDRTAANERGPLLQLNRTPEVRPTTRALSVSSMVWLIGCVVYLFYNTIKGLFLAQ